MNSAEEFQLSQIEVKYQDEVHVTFNAQLDATQQDDMLFQVTLLEDESQQYFVSGSVVDENDPFTAVLTFEENLPLDADYKLVAISVFDIQGRNIESGIESYDNFYVDPSTPLRPVGVEEPEVTEPEVTEPEVTEPEITEPVNNNEPDAHNSAQDEQEPIKNDVISSANDQDSLPQTGPTHILMLVMALVFGAMAFVFRFKK
jgi:LPXTG-motif cell wall-anchored protein